MCNRLQVDSARASSSEQTDITEKAIGFDSYNLTVVRGSKSMTILSGKADNEHIPTVFTLKVRGDVKWIAKERKPERVL